MDPVLDQEDGAELPHYFKYVVGANEGAWPKPEHVQGLQTADPTVVVNVPAGTGDWFGGWTGDRPSEGYRYANAEATSGRMVERIERGEPAVMYCHWPGLYTHGTKQGFKDLKQAILGLEGRFRDQTIWMKTSEIARYWAAKELTQINRNGDQITLTAPFSSLRFTLRHSTDE